MGPSLHISRFAPQPHVFFDRDRNKQLLRPLWVCCQATAPFSLNFNLLLSLNCLLPVFHSCLSCLTRSRPADGFHHCWGGSGLTPLYCTASCTVHRCFGKTDAVVLSLVPMATTMDLSSWKIVGCLDRAAPKSTPSSCLSVSPVSVLGENWHVFVS